jgi:hypothetical protein
MMVLQNQDIWFPNTLYLGRASQNQKIHGQKNVFSQERENIHQKLAGRVKT